MPFVFLDVPHTGVRLFGPHLAEVYGNKYFDDVRRPKGSFAKAKDQVVERTLFVRTRMPFGLHHKFDDAKVNVHHLAMIRNPVDRLVALYEGILANPDHVEFAAANEQTLVEFATGSSAMVTPNLQARTIAGVGPRRMSDADLTVRAEKNLTQHFLHLGTTEQFDDMTQLMTSRLGLPEPAVPLVAPEPPVTIVSDADRAEIEAHHQVDMALWQSATAKIEQRRREQAAPASLVVFQMGKVGSRSIVDAVEKATATTALHVHATQEASLERLVTNSWRRGLPVPPHVGLSRRLLRLIEQRAPLRIISLVREPIDRNLSAFFQNVSLQERLAREFDDADVDDYVTRFVDTYPHHIPLRWFDLQVKPALGIDVLAEPFDHDRGYAFFERDNIALVVMRAESSDALKRAAIEACFAIDLGEFATANVSSAKAYGDLYSQFKDRVILSEEHITEMYESRYSRHFYTDEERDTFAAKWRSRLIAR